MASRDRATSRYFGCGAGFDTPIRSLKVLTVVTSFATAYNMLSSEHSAQFELFLSINRQTELVVVDEAHQSTAPTYQAAIELFAGRNASTIGLTATPGRHTIDGDEAGTQNFRIFMPTVSLICQAITESVLRTPSISHRARDAQKLSATSSIATKTIR